MSCYWLTRWAVRTAHLTLLLLLASLLAPAVAQADGGMAISGSFSNQNFQIPQGSSVSGPNIDVIVFNTGSGELSVRMTSQAPVGVKITLSKNDFTIAPGGQQQVLIGIEVTEDAAPGQYEISVMAESYKGSGGGIQISGAARQVAKLVVLGESALVTVQAVSPEGQPLVATVQLYRIVTGQKYQVGYSEKGTLEAKVAPGSFVSTCYVGGQKMAEESFTVAANEKKTVTLSAATVYFEGFDIVPNN